MAEYAKTPLDLLHALLRNKWWALLVAFLVLTTFTVIAFVLPPVYRSTATILIEQQEIPQDLVRSTVTSYADQRIQIISQQVMTRSNLMRIVDTYKLFPDDRAKEPTEVIVEMMRDRIDLKMISADVIDPRSGRASRAAIAFNLSFEYQDPGLAQKVANELVSLYLNANLKRRTEMAAQTSSFLADETAKLAAQIGTFERELAKFKTENLAAMPDMSQVNVQLLERTERDLSDTETALAAVRERKIYLESQLAQFASRAFGGGDLADSADPAELLSRAKTQYVTLSSTYGNGHPDLVRLEKQIAALEATVGSGKANVELRQQLRSRLDKAEVELEQLRRLYSGSHADVIRLEKEVNQTRAELLKVAKESAETEAVLPGLESMNPAAVQLRTQLQATEIEMASLKEKQKALAAKFAGYEKRLTEAPGVERQLSALTRDYENAWTKYRELKAKQMEAELGESLETDRKGERFTLIEPPEAPGQPIKPNRIALLAIGLVMSLGAGIGVGVLAGALDGTVRGTAGVVAAVNVAPLAAVPQIYTVDDIRQARLRQFIISGVVVMAAAVTLAGMHLFFRPLDVLWFSILQRLGV